MDETAAIDALAALAQPTRLATLRLLMRALPDGVPAGEIARLLGAPGESVCSSSLIGGERYGVLLSLICPVNCDR